MMRSFTSAWTARRKSASVRGGATMTRALALRSRTTCSMAAGNAPNEAVLFEFVPVGISDTAAEVRPGALESAARTVAALLMCGRIVVDEHPLGLKIEEFLVAGVVQEQGLAAVTDEHEGVMGNLKLVHGGSPLNSKLTEKQPQQH